MLLITSIAVTLPIAIIGLALAAAYYLWLILDGLPLGWGIAGAIYCLWYMGGAYKMMVFLNRQGSVKTNADAAACLPFSIQLLLAVLFANSAWPYQFSALWALLLPLTFVLQLLLQMVFGFVLDLTNPAGKRPA